MGNSELTSKPGAALEQLAPQNRLGKHWLSPDFDGRILPPAFHAASAVEAALEVKDHEELPSLPEDVAHSLLENLELSLADPSERDEIRKSILDLASGKARAIVTGQQPGFGGGPLYTLYKISTTVALARLRTRKGLPTVPVFWMGDDDDDWGEAGNPLLWDGAAGELVASQLSTPVGQGRPDMIGTLKYSRLEKRTGDILGKIPSSNDRKPELVSQFKAAEDGDWNLSELTEKVIREVFKGTGLVIIRGNDSNLHKHSLGFYQSVLPHLNELVELTRTCSFLMEVDFGVEPLAPNSLNRPLYSIQGKKRIPWTEQPSPTDTTHWRCGVLLRSLLQDWLLKPAAVVVGPGELSYLSQMVPAYQRLGIERSPLVPRLFAWLLPEEISALTIRKFQESAGIDDSTAGRWATAAGEASEEELIKLLVGKIGVDPRRAGELAANRTRRWAKGVKSLLKNESLRKAETGRPSTPPWVFIGGQRQERRLAWIPCVATWGTALVDEILKSAEQHLQTGSTGTWNEHLIRVPVPKWWKEKGETS